MGKIHELNSVLADQIAAGEVIERPASIIKELVENSLDAHSKRIDIVVTKAGLGELRVIDDGEGIATEDVKEAFQRHATSKISTRQDLFRVQTMGFRGEALPSIASVADVVMTTATGGVAGTMIHLHGGKIESFQPASARRGTDVKVSELFFNTPARLKYLKSPHTELSRMVDIINRLALANPNVAISFTHDGREMFRSAGNGNVQQVVAAIYGVKVGRKMLPIHGKDQDFVVDGLISLPELTRASRQYMTITINHRYVRNYQISKAIIDGYGSKLMVGRYPVVMMNIDLDPLLVDVNVHPAKREVRLSKEPQLATLISETIRQRIAQQNLIPDVGERAGELLMDDSPSTVQEQANSYVQNNQLRNSDAKQSQSTKLTNPAQADSTDSVVKAPIVIHSRQELNQPELKEFDRKYQNEVATPFMDDLIDSGEQTNRQQQTAEVSLPIDDQGSSEQQRFPDLQYIGQLQGTFLLAQASDGLYIVDQHAAQERVNYEHYRQAIGEVSNDQQNFLQPLVLNYSVSDALKLNEHLSTLQQVGIHLEQFGQNSFILSSHPTWFIDGQEESTAREMIDWVIQNGSLTVAEFRAKTAIMMSCKRAIKANHYLNDLQAKALLNTLPHCENPFNCPHGRPVLIHFTDTDLEKLFKRIQESHQPFANEFDDHEY
ncbi:DNA mismatch repair endonuclease MutL [uncultured Limosilactobacillus sp.]|uniref:DNA mismatch repair endonuclease MutL n=1 Tax=uncultured Limosilactobacillus sp. TaxID=2837629 RepID=UPI0025CE367A|nr:DNA mismatch repair endonuclease MutL [uncultured Limosilactobacillus sp.]